jgi:hypothetical protein
MKGGGHDEATLAKIGNEDAMSLRLPFKRPKKENPTAGMSVHATLEVQPHVRVMTDLNGAVLLDLKAGRYYSLNGMGAKIWSQAEQGLTLAEILKDLQAAYQVPFTTLEQDVTSFLRGMEERGLIRARA